MGKRPPQPTKRRAGQPLPALPAAPDVEQRCAGHGFALSELQAGQLAEYLGLLMQWNSRMNLVGTRTWEKTLDNLVLDSFHLARFLEEVLTGVVYDEGQEIWDLGAGAGLPGIPLRMVWPHGEYWLVESREKRALFLSTVLTRISLPLIHVFRGRAEDFMLNRKASVILSRAFMPWPELLALVRPHIEPKGILVLLSNAALHDDALSKGTTREEEANSAPKTALSGFPGWVQAGSCSYTMPGPNALKRHLTALALEY